MKDKSQLSNYWINRAESLHRSSIILYDCEEQCKSLDEPLYLLAGLSLEVLLKAILVKKNQGFNEEKGSTHMLTRLLKETNIELDKSAIGTIEFFEEAIIWLSKYPMPKQKFYERAKSKMDNLRKPKGEAGFETIISISDMSKWPNRENYQKIWALIYNVYLSTPTSNSREFGYR